MTTLYQKDALTPRQRYLGRLWRWYRAVNYSHRKFNFDGLEVSADEHELYQYEAAEYCPPGYEVGSGRVAGSPPKLNQRRPTAPYRIPMAVVNRFTSLLFAGEQVPYVRHRFFPDVSELVEQLVVDVNMWQHMRQVRTFGGAVGTGVTAWHFEDSELVLEALDPRWVTPTWVSRQGGRVASVTIQYQYEADVLSPTGVIVGKQFWFRRRIDAEFDITFKPVEVTDKPPVFQADEALSFRHGFGICPVVWVQNTPSDDLDGDPDCYGMFDMIEVIDTLLSQGARGTIANCDPTLSIFTDEESIQNVITGSGHVLKLPANAKTQLMELAGSGPKTAYELAGELRRIVLETVRCVLDDPSIGDRATTTEVLRTTSAMHDRASEFRDQYGKHVSRVLVGLIQSIVAVHGRPITDAKGQPRRNELGQTEVAVVSSGMDPTRFDTLVRSLQAESRVLTAAQIELKWPLFTEPMSDDITKGVASAITARDSHLITPEHAIRYVARLLGVRDPERSEAELLATLKAERESRIKPVSEETKEPTDDRQDEPDAGPERQ